MDRQADRGAQRRRAELGLSAFEEQPHDTGMSLDQLNAAFAQMLGQGHDPYAQINEQEPWLAAAAGQASGAAAEIPADLSPRTICEAMLFVGSPHNEPLEPEQMARLMRGVRTSEIEEIMSDLEAQYAANGCPYRIESAGAGYRLTLRDEYAPIQTQILSRTRQTRLSAAAIEVLSIVAYHPRATAVEIEELRGKPCGALLRQLVRRQLLAVTRDDTPERARHYEPTPRFLQLLGLESLDELPNVAELDKR